MEIVLSIAGSDPSGGAGIQQDIKVISALGGYASAIITALTVQNTMGVQSVTAVDASVVKAQINAVLTDLDVKAVKIGQIPNVDVAKAIVSELKAWRAQEASPTGCVAPVIYDPIMMSSSGHQFMDSECVAYVAENLFPLCTLVTPNIPETEMLSASKLTDIFTIKSVGTELVKKYGTAFLIKGGHASGSEMTDTLFTYEGGTFRFTFQKVESRNLHGTGCTLSSAIATYMAQGYSLPQSAGFAKRFVYDAITRSVNLHIGHGNGPLCVFS